MEKKADFKQMSKKQIIGFIWDYYKWWFIIGAILIGSAIGVIRHFANYKDPVISIVMVNSDTRAADEEKQNQFTDYLTAHGYDPKKTKVSVRADYSLDLNGRDSATQKSDQALAILLAAGGVDVLTADEEVFDYLAAHSYFASLEDVLPKEELEVRKDQLVYTTDTETGEKYPVGIRQEKDALLSGYGSYPDGYVIGVVLSGENKAQAVEFLPYFLQQNEQ